MRGNLMKEKVIIHLIKILILKEKNDPMNSYQVLSTSIDQIIDDKIL